MIVGIDYIGGANCIDTIIRHHPAGLALRFLIKAGGWPSGLKAGRKFLTERQDVPLIGFHGTWHDLHIFTENDIPQAVKFAGRVGRLHERFPSVPQVFSPWLEPNRASYECKKKVYRKCRSVLRAYRIPVIVPGVSPINEYHHVASTQPTPYIHSFDGLDMLTELNVSAAQWLAIHPDAYAFFGWCFQCNGKKNRQDRRKRWERTNYVRKRHIERMARELRV
jgi:hypothetical protein